jgi:hypothetical protein
MVARVCCILAQCYILIITILGIGSRLIALSFLLVPSFKICNKFGCINQMISWFIRIVFRWPASPLYEIVDYTLDPLLVLYLFYFPLVLGIL